MRLVSRDGEVIRQEPKRVAICIPSGDMVHTDFAIALATLCYNPGAHCGIVSNKGSLIAINRNNGVDIAQQLKVDYLLFLDTDMTFPKDTLRRLLAHDKDIVGAAYTQRVEPFRTLAVPLTDREVISNADTVEVKAMPAGCLLIRMSVFDRLERPYFRMPAVTHPESGEPVLMGEDYYFCEAARNAGFSIWMDAGLSMEVGHIGQQTFRIPEEVPDAASHAA